MHDTDLFHQHSLWQHTKRDSTSSTLSLFLRTLFVCDLLYLVGLCFYHWQPLQVAVIDCYAIRVARLLPMADVKLSLMMYLSNPEEAFQIDICWFVFCHYPQKIKLKYYIISLSILPPHIYHIWKYFIVLLKEPFSPLLDMLCFA